MVLVFSKDKKADLKEISRKFPGCIIKEDKYAEIGKRCLLIFGPDDEIGKIKKKLDADTVVPGEEIGGCIDFQITIYPGETRKEALEIIREMHDSIIDFCGEVEREAK